MDAQIKKVQQALIKAGYSVGPAGADGILGRATTAAVASFQATMKLPINYPGTIGPITLRALKLSEDLDQTNIPPWIELANRKMGLHEKRNNAELKEFLKSDKHALGDPAKFPWCGDFVETCIAVTLPNEVMITNPYWALNWLKFGVEIDINKPALGAIGVKERDGGGHVFFVVGHDKTHFHCLGGNQSDSVSIVKIPKTQIKGLRYPATYPLPTKIMEYSIFDGELSVKES